MLVFYKLSVGILLKTEKMLVFYKLSVSILYKRRIKRWSFISCPWEYCKKTEKMLVFYKLSVGILLKDWKNAGLL